ncbi:MAG: hypothetical protein ABJA78_19680 [Ferruginibacter sp.]
MKKIIAILLFAFFLTGYSCFAQVHVVGGLATYKFWAGEDPDSTKTIINGEYWTFGHFTKEYKLYMEIKVRPALAKYFITDNNLKPGKYRMSSEAPKWFRPPKNFEVWMGSQESMYYINTKTGYIYMHEVQL